MILVEQLVWSSFHITWWCLCVPTPLALESACHPAWRVPRNLTTYLGGCLLDVDIPLPAVCWRKLT